MACQRAARRIASHSSRPAGRRFSSSSQKAGNIRSFLDHNFRHFNAATVIEAARAYMTHVDNGGRMMVCLGGAMSTAELGLTLAEMIRQDKVHIISCTGANLEEDLFNLVAHSYYQRIPDWRSLTPEQEVELLEKGMNRVTDTCIPEDEAMRRLEGSMLQLWKRADQSGERYFPHEFMYQALREGMLEQYYDIDPKDSWMVAACEKNIPIVVPGWEDSTMGNMAAGAAIKGDISSTHTVIKGGLDYMQSLKNWYMEQPQSPAPGMFQIGGGISGDFPICVVPMITQDLKEQCSYWGYFCQISEAATSYGSYSGAVPNEKITWGKLDIDTPKFIIESDASIVAPLVFSYVLNM